VLNATAASYFSSACSEPPAPNNPDPQSSGTQAFLNIPGVPGESTDTNHSDQIDVLSFSLGVSGPGANAGCPGSHSPSGGGTGSQQLSIVKNIDKSSPQLMLSAAVGTHYQTVTLTLRKHGATQDYLTYTFSTVFVTSVQWAHDDESPKEDVTFQYGQMNISYKPQNSDGSYASPIATCFSIDLQASC
jgi:type VI secretion system secreted protein Hcp